MKKDFIDLYSCFELSMRDQMCIPKEDIEKIVKRQLARSIADFILENIDELPIELSKRILENGNEENRLKLNLISIEEYIRLKNIESRWRAVYE